MKKFLNEVHKTIVSILRESVCPGCGDTDAYVGMNDVECPNQQCSNFSKRQYSDVKGTKQTNTSDSNVSQISVDQISDDALAALGISYKDDLRFYVDIESETIYCEDPDDLHVRMWDKTSLDWIDASLP